MEMYHKLSKINPLIPLLFLGLQGYALSYFGFERPDSVFWIVSGVVAVIAITGYCLNKEAYNASLILLGALEAFYFAMLQQSTSNSVLFFLFVLIFLVGLWLDRKTRKNRRKK